MAVGTPSASNSLGFSNAGIVISAFSDLEIRPAQIDQFMMTMGREALNQELLEFSNRGYPLWKVVSGQINIASGTATYALPPSLVEITEAWWSQTVTASDAIYLTDGSGNIIYDDFGNPLLTDPATVLPTLYDRRSTAMARDEWASMASKNQPGLTTSYWVAWNGVVPGMPIQGAPQAVLWPVPTYSAPTYAIRYFALARLNDANLGGAEIPDVMYRGYNALLTAVGKRLAVKFKPEKFPLLKALADEAWESFASRDQDPRTRRLSPQIGAYARGL